MLWSLSASLAVFVGYLTMYLIHHSLPVSLSDTFYNVKHPWKFSVCLILMAGCIFVPWIESSQRLDFLVFFACFSAILVAASPRFKEEDVALVHYSAAAVMFLCTMVWEIANGGFFHVANLFFLVGLIDKKRWVLWFEIGLFRELHVSLLLRELGKSYLLFSL